MWLVTAVGPVNGQRHFTFALEQWRSYTVGRDKQSDIRFESRHVRPKEGILEVGDWNPGDRKKPPVLVWKAEPKKNGTFNALKVVTRKVGEDGSTDKDDYDIEEGPGVPELELDTTGKGVELSADSWFIVQWRPVHFTYERMKDETEEMKATLRKHCVSWNEAFDPADEPEAVISPVLKSSTECNMAVCYGIPIVSPQWLQLLQVRLKACWKKVADSVDSFSVPLALEPDLLPELGDALPNVRQDKASWMPNPLNRELFSKWKIIALRNPKKPIIEKKWFITMGADFDEIDVFTTPLLSADDFLSRIGRSLAQASAAGRDTLVTYQPSTKKELAAKNVNFDSVIAGACARGGIKLASALTVWGAVRFGGVMEYLENIRPKPGATQTPPATAAPSSSAVQSLAPPPPEPLMAPPEPPRSTRLPRRAASRSTSRAPSVPPAAQPDAIPSTYPDEPANAAPTPAPVQPAEPSSSSSGRKKPLLRRGNRQPRKFDIDDDDIDTPTPEQTQNATQPQPTHVLETQLSGGTASVVPDSMEVDTVAPSLPRPVAATRSRRLPRRAGVGATQSSFLNDLDTTIHYEAKRKQQEVWDDARQLYEETKREESESMGQPQRVSKRLRTKGPSESREPTPAELMEVDEENDFVFQAIRGASKKEPASPKKRSLSPAKRVPEPVREETPEEEEEKIEEPPKKRGKAANGTKATQKATKATQKGTQKGATQVDKDLEFLQAISKKTKKAQDVDDEFNTEFNKMRIRKPQAAAPPDYAMVELFQDDLRGNFIEIVRKDLFRKDAPKVAAPIQAGVPNFKKFKKKNIVRREPVPLVLAAQMHSAEMGEPFWTTEVASQRQPTQTGRSQSGPRSTAISIDDEEDVPLVPRRRANHLSQIQEEDDDDVIPLPATTRRRGATPLTQAAPRSRRSTRASSAVSDSSSRAVTPQPPPKARATQRGKRATQAIRLLDDSDEDAPFSTAPLGPAVSGSTRSTRARTGRTTAATPSARSSTLQGETMLTRGTQSTRRRLLVEDDDDDTTFKGVQKKRRLG